jgi:prepilin-type N-terminal cleavage/methylation domain-containing protein
MKKTVRRGFTLPEVLVTVTVVAVLAAVVVPAVTQYVTKGDAPASQQDVNQVRNAVTGYLADTRHYPTYIHDLSTASNDNGYTGFHGPYLSGGVGAITGGNTATATFTSSGRGISLGGLLTQGTGFLTTPVTFTSTGATCQDLWNLDHDIDNSTPNATAADANLAAGNLTWTAAKCGSTSLPTDLISAQTSIIITLKVMPIGS